MITNIAENHLDVHGTMENYISAKQNIYRHQAPEDFLVLNYDDPIAGHGKGSRGKVFFFSMENRVRDGAYLKGGGSDLCPGRTGRADPPRGELLLPGDHNAANFLAAAVLSQAVGASLEAAAQVGRTFKGFPTGWSWWLSAGSALLQRFHCHHPPKDFSRVEGPFRADHPHCRRLRQAAFLCSFG